MKRGALLWHLLSLVAVLFFGYRAVEGAYRGWQFSSGRAAASNGDYVEAVARLDRGTFADLATSARWFASESRLGLWQQRSAEGATTEETDAILLAALDNSLQALADSPASGWYWMSVGNLLHQIERIQRFEYGEPLSLIGQPRWAAVGRPGRAAIGLMRIGVATEPNWYLFHDQLAYVYYDYRLIEEALRSVEASAAALPDYELHAYRTLRPRDVRIEEAFERGARDALGQVPWMREVVHHLALARLAVRLERWDDAKQFAEKALAGRTEQLNRAEGQYYLAVALDALGDTDGAREAMVVARTHPAIVPLAAAKEASWAERDGDLERAQQLLFEARRMAPGRLDLILRLADLSVRLGEVDAAALVMAGAKRDFPRDPAVLASFVRVRIAQENDTEAQRLFAELERVAPGHPALPGLRQQLATRQKD